MSLGFDQFFNNKFLSDCMITVNYAEFAAHKIVLAVSSEYFRTCFSTKLETTSNIVLTDISAEIMVALLQFMYTGSCEINNENVLDIYIAADYLQIKNVMELTIDYLIQQLSPANCISVYLFSKMCNVLRLQETTWIYLLRNIGVIMKNHPDEFLDLDIDVVVQILSSDYLNFNSEEKTWEAILLWVQKKPEEREPHFPVLLNTIRMGLLTPEFFLNEIRNHPAIAENEGCLPMISMVLRLLFEFEVPDLNTLARFRFPVDVVFAVGGWTATNVTNIIETYDTRADHWMMVTAIDPGETRAYHGSIVIGEEIFVIGGYNGVEYFNNCRAFNVVHRTWRNIAPMHKVRCYVSTVFCGGFIYAMGGYNGQRRQSTAERYDVTRNEWTLIQNMHSPRSDAAATSLNGKVYVMGGFNGHSCLNSAEVYDPETNTWEWLPPMSTRRSGTSCTGFENSIYILGGFNGRQRLGTAECYNIETRQWSQLPNMISNRSNFAVAVVEDGILVMGGYDGTTTIPHVECFNPNTSSWISVNPLNVARSAFSACVASNFPNIESYSYQNLVDTSQSLNINL